MNRMQSREQMATDILSSTNPTQTVLLMLLEVLVDVRDKLTILSWNEQERLVALGYGIPKSTPPSESN